MCKKSLCKLQSPMYYKISLLVNFTAPLLSSSKAGALGILWWSLIIINGHGKQWQCIKRMCVKSKCQWDKYLWRSPFEDSLCHLLPPCLHLCTWPQLLLQVIFLRTLWGLFLLHECDRRMILTSSLSHPPKSNNERATTTNILGQLLAGPMQP